MKFEIVGLDENYGKHRFSNNAILQALREQSAPDSEMLFVWWVEKMFLGAEYGSVVERLCETEWFGVMHVPLLTPNWAMYSQNNLAKLYFMPSWRKALKKCRGIITLSDHMQEQLSATYPDLNVFSAKHPIPEAAASFNFDAFQADPKLLLVGAWLRDFDGFHAVKSPWRKKLIFNHYAEDFITRCYHKYRPRMLEDIKSLDHVSFLENDDYDALVQSSVLYLNLHETSANNALCECIAYAAPFVSLRHPAIEEYCGPDYPLFVDDICTLDISISQVREAHDYLKERQELRDALSMNSFVSSVREIWHSI